MSVLASEDGRSDSSLVYFTTSEAALVNERLDGGIGQYGNLLCHRMREANETMNCNSFGIIPFFRCGQMPFSSSLLQPPLVGWSAIFDAPPKIC